MDSKSKRRRRVYRNYYISRSKHSDTISLSFSYIINGNKVTDDFDNKNPETTVSNPIQDNINTIISTPIIDDSEDEESIEDIDTNGNGVVTIAEAKKAGFTMPIRSDHWLYKYMVDGDQDGMVGE